MTKSLKGECQKCGGHLEFAADAVGTAAECPHCGKTTELLLAAPKSDPAVPRKTIIFTIVAILILAGGLVATIIVLKRAERMTKHNSETPSAKQPSPSP